MKLFKTYETSKIKIACGILSYTLEIKYTSALSHFIICDMLAKKERILQ